MDAVLALQEAVGVIPLDGNGCGLDARLVSVLIVQDLVGEVVALRPAGVHAVEHLGPVLGLGAAGAGVEGQNGAVAVVLSGEQRGHPGFLHLFLQRLEAGLQLVQQLRVVRLLAHLAQGRQVLPLGHQLVLAGDLVLQLLVQLGTQVPELLLIFVVFDQSHEISPLPQISLAIVLYRRDLDL